MQKHALIGAEIIGEHDADLLHLARVVALSHHERWDGNGYPYRLAEENIPLEGRIVSIADVFDALTSVRPYKKAWPVNEARDYIDDQTGKAFDPHLTKLFLQNLPAIVEINRRFVDPPEAGPTS